MNVKLPAGWIRKRGVTALSRFAIAMSAPLNSALTAPSPPVRSQRGTLCPKPEQQV